MLAYSQQQVRREMATQDIRILKTIAKSIPMLVTIKHQVKPIHITAFTHQLALMLDAGLSIGMAMAELKQSNQRQGLTALIEEISFQVQQGQALSNVLQTFAYFDSLYLQFVRIGEANGDLAKALNYCVQHREKNLKLLKQIRSALFYPISVIIVACIIMAIMLVFVIPQFSSLFHSFGAELPALTQLTLDVSLWFQFNIGKLVIGCVALVCTTRLLIAKSSAVRYQLAKGIIKTPALGHCVLAGELARFNLLLCNGIQAGLPLVLCIDNATGAVHNAYLKQQLSHINHDIRQGTTLHVSLSSISCLPPLMLKMLTIGELSGRLGSITDNLATIFEQQVDETTDKLGKLIEPMIIVFLGVIVGGLVLSMYLPIFSLMSAVG
ncbi:MULTISPECIES: type II secretion system F family protein [unclassified Vibrio]|uniref:type II secretion system F family protein n=1 Tax=unclassified Vibrio TaxID=2614977 RepID=UPI001E2D0B30|nr:MULTISPECIES: type II secretion system F family protein [unclassified Vibrio]